MKDVGLFDHTPISSMCDRRDFDVVMVFRTNPVQVTYVTYCNTGSEVLAKYLATKLVIHITRADNRYTTADNR